MHCCAKLLLGLWLLSAVSGCKHNDLVEAELRTRERELRELRSDLSRYEWENDALHREVQSMRNSSPPSGISAKVSPELAAHTFTVKNIVLGRATGGFDDDHLPGDEALQVIVEPKDADGHTIKAPGSMHIEALEISTEGLKIGLCSWDLDTLQVRRSWRSGFLSTGYAFILPWKKWPTSERLRVVARFTLVDGRMFEADKDVTIRLPPGATRRVSPPPIEAPVPAGSDLEAPSLPEPRKVEPTKSSSAKAWWELPGRNAAIQSAPSATPIQSVKWRPAAESPSSSSLIESVQLLRPVPLTFPPGENPE